MSTPDALSFGPAGGLRFSRNSGRSLTSEALGAIRYPSPFFDIAHTYLPSSFKTMLRWCRYYFLTNPLINAVCYKMAEYPVTDLVFDTTNEELRKKWEYIFGRILNFKKFEVEAGLDYNTYGNAFISISFPFQKLLICKRCGFTTRADDQKYLFREYKFVGDCKRCGNNGDFRVRDHYLRSIRDIRLIRWNPEYITVQHNDATAEDRFYYSIPPQMANDIRMAKRHIVERVPQVFIEALRQNKALLFSRDNIYHMKRPTIAQKDKGWGMPMILPVLKDVFYLQVLRKAQEAIAVEHIVPLRLLFPQTSSSTADVYCVSLNTLIETREGPRPAYDVRVGDYLKSHKGAWDRVEAIKDRSVPKSEKVYRFKVASLPAFPFELSEEHPIWASRKWNKEKGYDGLSEPSWVNAKDLKKGDFVLYPTTRKTWSSLTLDLAEYIPERAVTEHYIYRRLNQASAEIYEYLEERGEVHHQRGEREKLLQERGWLLEDYRNAYAAFSLQEKIDRIPRHLPVTEDLAYLVGLYAAEGYLNGGSPCFALHSREVEIRQDIDRIVEALGFRAGCSGTYDVTESGVTHNVHDVLLGAFLRTACGSNAEHKRLPRFVLEAPKNIAMAAARGLLAGDGCNFKTETRRIGLMSVSKDLVVGLRSILLSEGFIPTAQVRIPNEGEIAKLPAYQLNLNGSQADELARRFGWDRLGWTPGDGKQGSQCGFIRDGYVYLRINEVEEAPEVETVRGFQMEGDRSFCVVGVATHNSTINLTQWRDKIEQELIRWRLDNNYIPLLPIPVGQQTLGGEGKALMLAQEYRVWSEQVIAGMGVPIEFVYGGMQYSGSNVSMRILENHFLDQKTQRKQLITDFLMPNIGAFMGWEVVPCHYKPFKMADDLQRSAFHLQLNQAGKMSDRTLLEDVDRDHSTEMNQIREEQKLVLENQRSQALAQASIQGEAQLVGIKYQGRAQKIMMEQQGPPPSPQDAKALSEAGMQASGQPGMASPMATGQAMNAQMGMMNQTGQIPPMEFPNQQQEGQQQDPMAGIQSPLNAGQNGSQADLMGIAQQVASHLNQLPDHEKQMEMGNMQKTNPQLYSLVLSMVLTTAGADKPSNAVPLPEQRPPQRGPEAAMV